MHRVALRSTRRLVTRQVARDAWRLLSTSKPGPRLDRGPQKPPPQEDADPAYVSPEAEALRDEARDAIDTDALDAMDAELDKYVECLSQKDKRLLRRDLRNSDEKDLLGAVDEAEPTENDVEDPDELGSDPDGADELPNSPLLRKMDDAVGGLRNILENLGGPQAAEFAAAAGRPNAASGRAAGLPSLDADFWRAFPVAAPALQRRHGRGGGANGPDSSEAPRPTPGLSKAAQRRRRASDERARLLAERSAALGLGGFGSGFGPAGGGRGGSSALDWASDDGDTVTVVAEAAPGGGVRPAAESTATARPPASAAPRPSAGRAGRDPSSPPAVATASPFSLACAALGIDPYAVTPASLGLHAPAGDEGAAAEAWEDALAAVDMEEEGGGIPAHSPRTGALLTDRQRRAYALARAALSFFPTDDPAFPWAALSGKGLSVEGVLRGAGLQPEDLGGEETGGESEAEVRKRIRAALLTEAGRRSSGGGGRKQ